MSEKKGKTEEASEEFVNLSTRESKKKFKKQRFVKASSEEKILVSQLIPPKEIVWFDPVVSPEEFVLKQPTLVKEGFSFLLYAAVSSNIPIEILPKQFSIIATGFCVHRGFFRVNDECPNWGAIIVSLNSQLSEGVFVASSLIDLQTRKELKVSLFNMSDKKYVVAPADPIAELVFHNCEVPEIAYVSSLAERFKGEIFQS